MAIDPQSVQAVIKTAQVTELYDFYFPLNPRSVRRARMPNYAQVNGALMDYTGNYQQDAPAPFEWINNNPEEIRIEFMLHAPDFASADVDVDADLEALDLFMSKPAGNAEPYDLIFAYGKRHDLVRIFEKDVEEHIHSPDLRVLSATVRLTMRTLRARLA